MPVVTLAIWLSLTFCVLASIASAAWAGSRGWQLWRGFSTTSGQLTDALGRVTSAADAVEQRATAVTAGTERLLAATERLQRSLAELEILRRAASEPQGLLAKLRELVPRK
jgi:methyl-accepting chemotaxis protein